MVQSPIQEKDRENTMNRHIEIYMKFLQQLITINYSKNLEEYLRGFLLSDIKKKEKKTKLNFY